MATPAEIAASLTMEDIPVKLRCAACNKLAIEAYRMPCCDQSICDDCQASLPEACPVCLHEPVKPDDCRPNKALRTTIKVFLKKKVIERDTAEKKRKAAEKAAATPLPDETLAPKPSQTPAAVAPEAEKPARQPSQISATAPHDTDIEVPSDAKAASRDASQAPQTANDAGKAAELGIPTEAQKDVPQMSIESPGPGVNRRMSTQTAGDGSVGQEKADGNEKNAEHQHAAGQNEQWTATNGFAQGTNNGAIGFDGTNGGFPNMSNMAMAGMGDFSQMMQFMPNGMPNPMMGSFPNMMGMPGMGMDPMAMAPMYGGQGMGMNGMNMGMGFDAGQGAFGGFNGQPAAWNAGQNKYNHNAYGGHAGMGGIASDYGANAGYGGYNMPPQGNFNQMHQHQYPNNDFHHGHHGQGFQNRGRGRGRGYQNAGRGRGGYNNYNPVQQGNQTNSAAPPQEVQVDGVTRRGSPSYGDEEDRPADQSNAENKEDAKAEADTTNSLTAEEQFNKELDPGDAEDYTKEPKETEPKEETVPESTEPIVPEPKASDQSKAEPERESVPKEGEEKPAPIQTFISDEPANEEAPTVNNDVVAPPTMLPPPSPIVPTGPAALHTADPSTVTSPRGRGYGRGFDRGFHHRGGTYGRGSYLPNGNLSHVQAVVKPLVPPVAPKGLGVEGAPKGPKALREGHRNTGVREFSTVGRATATTHARPNGASITKSPSRERSRSPSRHQSSHHRHHRHRSTSPSSSTEREKRRERHHRSSRRREEEKGDEPHDTKGSRHRDASVGSSTKRSSRRSRRDYDKEPKDAERSSHRSHRSHRDRSRDRDAEKEQHPSSRKKEKTPELSIYGASRMNGSASAPTKNTHKNRVEEEAPSSRKRRSDDEENYRDQKRKRRGQEEDLEDGKTEKREDSHRSSRPLRPSKRDSHSHSNTIHADPPPTRPHATSLPQQKEIPKGPKQDNNAHLSEREKYAQERIARENQRRLSQLGPAAAKGGGGKLSNGKGAGRRGGQKYEDDETISRGESEREAMRYR